MTTSPSIAEVEGLGWMGNGQAVLSGALLALADRLDQLFCRLASRWGAAELRFPTFIPAAELDRVDYFRSFPQLATFPACLAEDDENLERFTSRPPVSADGAVRLAGIGPVLDVLTPAACYHLYIHHKGQRFDRPRYFTTRNTCFRRESHYLPLERQWSFTMREIVCMGTGPETRAFLEEAEAAVDGLAHGMGLPVAWSIATDPFFRPSANPAYLMQKVDPTKRELLFEERLAIGSVNLHHDHFGRAYSIARGTGRDVEPVHTACVAFGIERWLAAFLHHFGTEGPWPELS